MCNKVTYLLGAGASANCLPVVSKMAERIEAIKVVFSDQTNKHISTYRNEMGQSYYKIVEDTIRNIISDLQMLIDKCKNYSSIDTYAKKVFLGTKKKIVEQEDYYRLKMALSVYFTLEQWYTPIDKRYDNFWASILNVEGDLPKNFNILSWNYDSQLELSYANFFGIDLKRAYDEISIKTFGNRNLNNSNGFNVFKLNGSARYSNKNNSGYLVVNYIKFKKEEERDFLKSLIISYSTLNNAHILNDFDVKTIDLFFAWEHFKYMSLDENYYEDLQKSIKGTTTLAIIGYSFPFFNRNVDNIILNRTIGQTLNKIYIQDINPEEIEERLRSVLEPSLNPEIVLIRDKNQFIFPNELTI
jgi:hypothetical protein